MEYTQNLSSTSKNLIRRQSSAVWNNKQLFPNESTSGTTVEVIQSRLTRLSDDIANSVCGQRPHRVSGSPVPTF